MSFFLSQGENKQNGTYKVGRYKKYHQGKGHKSQLDERRRQKHLNFKSLFTTLTKNLLAHIHTMGMG